MTSGKVSLKVRLQASATLARMKPYAKWKREENPSPELDRLYAETVRDLTLLSQGIFPLGVDENNIPIVTHKRH